MIRLGRGAWKGHVLRPDFECRPTTSRVREAVLDILGPGWMEGRRVWDLYAGSGALGLESLGCGADRAAFVDLDPRSCRLIRDFLRDRGELESAVIIRGDVRRSLDGIGFTPDLVFADPPYGEPAAYDWLSQLPWRDMLAPGGRVFVESGPKTVMEGWRRREYGRSLLHELKLEGNA
jgi:16S rRNA (guanine966-N2)-methyltransferase